MIGAILTIIQDEARRIWCHRWLGLACAAIILAIGLGYVASIGHVYDAWGQVYVDKQTPMTEAARGVSLTGDAFGSAAVVEKALLSDQNLERLVRETDPAAARMSRAELAKAVARMRERIRISSEGEGFVEFHYVDSDPVRAARIAKRLLDQYITTNVNRSRSELNKAAAFLDNQIAAYKVLLADSQSRIEGLRRSHAGLAVIPASVAETATEEVLVGGPAVADAVQPAKPSAAAEHVASLESKLEQLRGVYTEEYPDVVSVRRQLADAVNAQSLEAIQRPVAMAKSAGSGTKVRRVIRHAKPRPVVPPAVAADWADAQRKAEMLRANYQQLIARREAARVSLAIFGSDAFQVTRPPAAPMAPVGPRHRFYGILVVAAAVGGGLAAAYLRGALRGIMVSPRELELACQLPVIGTVSWEPAWSTAHRRGRGLGRARHIAPRRALPWLFGRKSVGEAR
jgi:hypothetical protein